MYTLKDASDLMGLNINTLRYRLARNSDDCDRGIYETRLYSLLHKIRVIGKNSKTKAERMYERYIILDFEEFKTEYENYEKFLKENRKRKRKHNLGWSVSAIECFQRNMKCSKCACEKICKRIADKTPDKIPPMKKTIQKLLSELGLPPKL